MKYLSSHNRQDAIQHVQGTQFDIAIIGGGATGAGIALDAASRGLSVALVEKQDFAAGTSSRSTKLIHGGLRYLKQFEIALVREVGRERAIVHKLAPHLVVSEKMLLPLVKGGAYSKLMTSFGLMVYDVLAGVEHEDQRVMLSKEETMEKEPYLSTENLEGSGFYAEYRTDDARLTIEVIKTAANYGATCLNYIEAVDFLYKEDKEGKKIKGLACKDLIQGKSFQISAKAVISAAGPWVDELRTKNNSMTEKHLYLTKGVHIVVPHEKLPVKQAVYFEVPDGRMVFAIPRGKITYIGTTDTEYKGNKENPRTNLEDVEYLLLGANKNFPLANLTSDDVISSWAGLRPLIHEAGKSASEISRKDEIFISPTGLISIAGGKLTGYRKMAERTVDQALKVLKLGSIPTRTRSIVLEGGEFGNAKAVRRYKKEVRKTLAPYGIDANRANYLVSNYGRQCDAILKKLAKIRRDQYSPSQRLILAELDFCMGNEMIQSPLDFFSRRTGRLYFDIASVKESKELIIEELANQLNWDATRKESMKKELDQAIYEASNFPNELEMSTIEDI